MNNTTQTVKTIRSALLSSVLLVPALWLSPAAAEVHRVTADDVNGRELPGVQGKVISRFHFGDQVDVVEVSGQWARVHLLDKESQARSDKPEQIWIAKTYLQPLVPALGEEVSNTAPKSDLLDNQPLELNPLDCLLTPSVEVALASPVAGVIRSVHVDRGDYVKKRQVVVSLHDEVEKATLNLNKTQASFGKRTIARNSKLYSQKLISEQEKDQIEIDNMLFELEAKQTQAQINQKRIRTPIAGVVTQRMLDPGEYVGEDPILTIAKLNPLYIELVVPVELFGKVKKGQSIPIELAQPVGGVYNAKIDIVDQVIDAASATFGVRLTLENPGYKIPAGLKCSVKL